MRSRWTVVFTTLALLSAPAFVSASDDVSAQLQQMQERLSQMEDRLQATTDELDAANERADEQSELIDRAGLFEARGDSNGLAAFVNSITLTGWVSGSYLYSANDVGTTNGNQDGNANFSGNMGQLGGNDGLFYPFHPDHNTFSLDQVWFEMEKPIDESSRAGFRFDVGYGKTAGLLGGGGLTDRSNYNDDNSIYVAQGYIQYLMPVADNSMTLKAGKFGTHIGIEVPQTVYNWNITRGNVYNLLQPIDHIGVKLEGDMNPFGMDGMDYMVGLVNGFNEDSPDPNDGKSVIYHLGWTGESVSASLNGIYGAENRANCGGTTTCDDDDKMGVVDVILTWDATEDLSTYVNFDYGWTNQNHSPGASGEPNGWGVAWAGRYAVSDRSGVAVRMEYAEDSHNWFGFGSGFTDPTQGGMSIDETNVWSITTTVDHLITDHLMVRAELRYDWVDFKGFEGYSGSPNDRVFFDDDNDGFDEDQLVGAIELIYNFTSFTGN